MGVFPLYIYNDNNNIPICENIFIYTKLPGMKIVQMYDR